MSKNDPKYNFIGGSIINEASGQPIPEDEPCMVFRARDIWAVYAIESYLSDVEVGIGEEDTAHVTAVKERIAAFRQFAKDHPDRMKEPDTESST
ncbi:MAG: hypothetical protein AAFO74_13130 [Pseudomonadota bacterium]